MSAPTITRAITRTVTAASIRAMRRRAYAALGPAAFRWASNTKDARLKELANDVIRLCAELERTRQTNM
jgi:hypothetical protein